MANEQDLDVSFGIMTILSAITLLTMNIAGIFIF
jgi:hypothetical protein